MRILSSVITGYLNSQAMIFLKKLSGCRQELRSDSLCAIVFINTKRSNSSCSSRQVKGFENVQRNKTDYASTFLVNENSIILLKENAHFSFEFRAFKLITELTKQGTQCLKVLCCCFPHILIFKTPCKIVVKLCETRVFFLT